ncbi:MAG: SH3b protein [Deltaproteobacteria bacterium]|nr:SH3b protein [Deltaproteobacteria bacterium]
MIGESTTRTRLCPYCANSIDEPAAKCSYCKADLLSGIAPKWLNRNEPSSEPRVDVNNKKKFPIPTKFIGSVIVLVVVLLAFFAGGYIQRSELSLLSQANLKQLQVKDQIIQSQQAELAQVQKQLSENSNQLGEMKSKLEENQKALSATQQRLGVATRAADRLNATRSVAVRRSASRAPDTPPSLAQPVTARRTVEPGVYETTQATSVYENPSSTARVISQIARGTRINVVSSAGDWLEVRSNRGNPPGYVRSDDARLIGRVN